MRCRYGGDKRSDAVCESIREMLEVDEPSEILMKMQISILQRLEVRTISDPVAPNTARACNDDTNTCSRCLDDDRRCPQSPRPVALASTAHRTTAFCQRRFRLQPAAHLIDARPIRGMDVVRSGEVRRDENSRTDITE
jgi:hypothetical protein